MPSIEERQQTLAELRQRILDAISPIAWILDGDYPEPSDDMKPFVYELLHRACKGDEDAVGTLTKLFPPRFSA